MSTLIRGGRVIRAEGEGVADVLVEDGMIAAIGSGSGRRADRVLDASGKLVLPGAVDVHVHIDSPDGGVMSCDDFATGTRAAACGGTTTIVAFAEQVPGMRLDDALAAWRAKLDEAELSADVGLHMIVTDAAVAGALDDLVAMADAGVPSFKLFLAYKGTVMVDDRTFLRVAQTAASCGAVVMVHAENGDAIDLLSSQALSSGETAARWHGLTRPPLTEAEATSRAIDLCTLAGAPLYVVHVSCREALAPLARAREAGLPVWGETCPQYLLLDESGLELPGREAAKYIFTPPPRTRDNQEHLWRALVADVLSTVGSDHCPYRLADKLAAGASFAEIRPGAPGIETRVPLLYGEGVRGGRMGLQRMVELLATAPARLFGLYPRKGVIEVGSDADIVVLDPSATTRISARTQQSRADYTLYEQRELPGAIETVLVRGRAVVEDGAPVLGAAPGAFVRRARFGTALVSRGATSVGGGP